MQKKKIPISHRPIYVQALHIASIYLNSLEMTALPKFIKEILSLIHVLNYMCVSIIWYS